MSKKFVLTTAALGFLSCVLSSGCCHLGACGGGSCSNGSCGSDAYGSSEYANSGEYASGEEDYEEFAQSRPAAVTAQRQNSNCRNGSCPN